MDLLQGKPSESWWLEVQLEWFLPTLVNKSTQGLPTLKKRVHISGIFGGYGLILFF